MSKKQRRAFVIPDLVTFYRKKAVSETSVPFMWIALGALLQASQEGWGPGRYAWVIADAREAIHLRDEAMGWTALGRLTIAQEANR